MSPTSWAEVRKGLVAELRRLESKRFFESSICRNERFKSFNSAESLIAWLLDHSSHPAEDEDEALKCLWSLQDDADSKPFWSAAIALGLWPALEWCFCKIRPKRRNDSEAASEIWDAFENCLSDRSFCEKPFVVKRLISRIRSIANRSTRIESRRDRKLREAVETLPDIYRIDPFKAYFGKEKPKQASDDELRSIERLLVDVFGLRELDAMAVALHAAGGKSHSEIAGDIGSSEAAVRQRYSRAIRKIRTKIKKDVTFSGLSDMGIQGGKNADRLLH